MNIKSLISSALLLLLPLTLPSQTTERFIRVIGNSKYEFKSDLARVTFFANEIPENKYREVKAKDFKTVYTEYVKELEKIEIREGDIKITSRLNLSQNKVAGQEYYIDILEESKIADLVKIQVEGVRISSVKYLYQNVDPEIETKLSLQAIEDAKSKAMEICNSTGTALGKILNIEDRSNGCCREIGASNSPKVERKYKITVTFELMDQ